jgi:hypothetical protein
MEKETKKLLLSAAIIRGTILNSMTMLERMIDIFISNHFCKDPDLRDELLMTVFATKMMIFENKRNLFNHLLITHDKKYDKRKVEGLHTKLDEFNKERNKLAHYSLDISDEAIVRFGKTKEVIFIDLNKKWGEVIYTIEKAKAYSKSIESYISPVVSYYKEK